MTEYQKYFMLRSKGGYSNCLDRGQGNVLPNCVGYAWGCFYFFHGSAKMQLYGIKGPGITLTAFMKPVKRTAQAFGYPKS